MDSVFVFLFFLPFFPDVLSDLFFLTFSSDFFLPTFSFQVWGSFELNQPSKSDANCFAHVIDGFGPMGRGNPLLEKPSLVCGKTLLIQAVDESREACNLNDPHEVKHCLAHPGTLFGRSRLFWGPQKEAGNGPGGVGALQRVQG